MPAEMQVLSAKMVRTARVEAGGKVYGDRPAHWCPGCEELHEFAVERPFHNGARWTWDGNVDAPTFSPSMNIGVTERCHYFLKAGRLQFLGDCTHAFRGQTVPLPDLPESVVAKAKAPNGTA